VIFLRIAHTFAWVIGSKITPYLCGRNTLFLICRRGRVSSVDFFVENCSVTQHLTMPTVYTRYIPVEQTGCMYDEKAGDSPEAHTKCNRHERFRHGEVISASVTLSCLTNARAHQSLPECCSAWRYALLISLCVAYVIMLGMVNCAAGKTRRQRVHWRMVRPPQVLRSFGIPVDR
jgi:hypothetical protein